ncbi:MAG TPA: nucleotidyltransferase domain-containing protein [Candidatus Rifleibacterium sp.]|nr:nucleotidyltransferase domain-containing protein [Candidatus Rifleibacterium sp.]
MFKIDPFLPEIEKICKKYEAKSLTLFGSALTEEFNPDSSDLDFLLELTTPENGFDRYFGIKEELEKLLNREVDLVMPKAIRNPYLKESIYSKLKRCYDA